MATAAVLTLSACGPDVKVPDGTMRYVQGFAGVVAAEEPQAAMVGRDVLAAGGTAADAAVALYFALSVTLPSAAGLGGGGACVVHDRIKKVTEVLDFRPPAGVPGNPRGFQTLHARYGKSHWEQLIGPAERMARFGVPVSRALATALAPIGDALLKDPETRKVFAGKKWGATVGEGDMLVQAALADTLARLRVAGPGELDGGNAVFQPVWQAGARVDMGWDKAVAGAAMAGALEATLAGNPPTATLAGNPPAAAAAGGASSTGFVVASKSQAVACAVGTGVPFGSGRNIPGAGFSAGAPGAGGEAALVVNPFTEELHAAVAGHGAAAVASVLKAALRDGQPLAQAVAAVEPGVQALACTSLIDSSCWVAADPRSHGMAIRVGE